MRVFFCGWRNIARSRYRKSHFSRPVIDQQGGRIIQQNGFHYWKSSLAAILLVGGMIGCSPVHESTQESSLHREKESPAVESFEQGSRLRGYVVINEMIAQRFLNVDEDLGLGQYLDAIYTDSGLISFGGSILDLLGGYSGGGYGSRFQNGEPNALNMLLWYLLLENFSQNLGQFCQGSFPLKLKESVREVLQDLCQWPQRQSPDEVLARYWFLIMGFDAPVEELSAWQDLARTPQAKQWSAEEVIAHLTLAILYNPYFLLGH